LASHTKGWDLRVLRRIFRPKKEKVVGSWRRQHNEELHNLYTSPNIIRVIKLRMTLVGHVAHMGEMTNEYKILVRKSERKRPLRRHRHRWEDNIRTDLRGTEWEDVDCMHLAQDREQ
jgi:hypothetical protein